MITPTPKTVQFGAKINAADFTTLCAAITATNILAMPEGKTLADVTNLNLSVLPTALPDGTVAVLNAGLKV